MSRTKTLAKSQKKPAKKPVKAVLKQVVKPAIKGELVDKAKPIPRHGIQNLIPVKKGEIRNPLGINRFTSQKAKMMDAATALAEKAMRILAKQLDSTDERIQQQAAKEILDRGFGKPVQSVAQTDTEGNDRPPPPPMLVNAVHVTLKAK